MAITIGKVLAAALAAGWVLGGVQDMQEGGSRAGPSDEARRLAPDVGPERDLRGAEQPGDESRRAALMYQPEPMRAVAAALRARQRQMQPGRPAGGRAAASPARSTGH